MGEPRNQGLWVPNRNGHRQVFALHLLSSFVLEHLTSASQEWRFISKKTLDLTKTCLRIEHDFTIKQWESIPRISPSNHHFTIILPSLNHHFSPLNHNFSPWNHHLILIKPPFLGTFPTHFPRNVMPGGGGCGGCGGCQCHRGHFWGHLRCRARQHHLGYPWLPSGNLT